MCLYLHVGFKFILSQNRHQKNKHFFPRIVGQESLEQYELLQLWNTVNRAVVFEASIWNKFYSWRKPKYEDMICQLLKYFIEPAKMTDIWNGFHVCLRGHTHTHTYTHIYTDTYMYICVCVCGACVRACVSTCMYKRQRKINREKYKKNK